MGRNQHYIPQFYQKYWECERKGYLWEFDKFHKGNKDKGIRMQAIRSRNSEEYLYEPDVNHPDDVFEQWYGKFETLNSDRYKNLVSSRGCLYRVRDEYKDLLCRLYAHFSARNPRNLYQNEENNALAAYFTLGEKDPVVDRKNIQNIVAFSQGEMIEVFGRENEKNNLDKMGKFAKILYSCNLQILISDKPSIVFCNNITEQVTYRDRYYFPISPYMLAVFTKDRDKEDGIVRRITSDEYSGFIRLYLNDTRVERIYASNKETFQEVAGW